MKLKINKIAVIGTGVIGTGWIIRLLFNKKIIYVFDTNLKQKKIILSEIERTKKFLKKFYKQSINIKKQIIFCDTLKMAVENADLIQENVPENESIKIKVIYEISAHAKKNAIISSSSSGLLPTKIQKKCINPERMLISHPFNPVYLLPLVEIVPGKKTKKIYINKSIKFYKSIGMHTLLLKKELPGYLSDRLQEAMWRESLHIINENYASTKDLDDAIIYGPGLRWSLMGIFLTFHLAGGELGMKHMLKQFGPALKLPWTKLKAPKLTNVLSNKIIKGSRNQSKGSSIMDLSNLRDNYLIELLKLRKKYKIK